MSRRAVGPSAEGLKRKTLTTRCEYSTAGGRGPTVRLVLGICFQRILVAPSYVIVDQAAGRLDVTSVQGGVWLSVPRNGF